MNATVENPFDSIESADGGHNAQKTFSGLWGTLEDLTPVQYATDYFWVVVCKNHRFHDKGNIGYEYRILLGETDALESVPMLLERIKVRCESCGRGYSRKSRAHRRFSKARLRCASEYRQQMNRGTRP